MNINGVLHNLKEYDSWEYSHYKMTKEEANICIDALEKQKQKKSDYYGDEEDGKILCPNCHVDLWNLKECGFNNCPYCGQALLWEE